MTVFVYVCFLSNYLEEGRCSSAFCPQCGSVVRENRPQEKTLLNQQNKIIIGKLLFKNKYFTGSGCLFLILWCNIIYIVDVDVMLTVLYLFMFCYEIQMCYYVISYRNGFHCAVSFDSSLYPDSRATFCCRVLGFRTKIIKPFMVKVRCLFGSLSVTVNYYFLV